MKNLGFYLIVLTFLPVFAPALAAPVPIPMLEGESGQTYPKSGKTLDLEEGFLSETTDYLAVITDILMASDNKLMLGPGELIGPSEVAVKGTTAKDAAVKLSSVPLPGGIALFITGLLGAGLVARKKLVRHRRKAISA
ncbi:MAG: hypothetical protein KGY54_12200 [Oleiphilaceae bacterium]|nr:hypothetical protein [Oleiphilaceae bacterium]